MQTSQTDTPAAPPGAPSGKAARAATRAAGREAFVSARADEPPLSPDLGDEADAAAAAAASAAPVDPVDEENEAEAALAEPAPAAKEPPIDPAAAKRLEAAQREERRRKEQIAKERAEAKAAHDAREAKLKEREDAIAAQAKRVADYEAAVSRAKVDPIAAFHALGYAPEDLDIVAKAAWYASPAGQAAAAKDPTQRDEVMRTLRERELLGAQSKQGSEVAELRDLIAKQNERIEQMTREQSVQGVANEFLDHVEDSVGDEHPVLSRALTAAKAKAADRTLPVAERREAAQAVKALRAEFLDVARDLYQRDGVEPDPADVAAEVESRRVAQMKRWGLDPSVLAKPVEPKKPAGTPPPRVLGKGNGAPAQPPRKLTPEEKRAEFIRNKQAGKLDES